VQTLLRSKEFLNHPITQNALLPNGTLPCLEHCSSSPLRQLRRRPLKQLPSQSTSPPPCWTTSPRATLPHSSASNTLAESVSKPLVDVYKDKFNPTPTFDPRASAMFARRAKLTSMRRASSTRSASLWRRICSSQI
ncbi:hypothetical protein C0992_006137, partial [Termitomyces sp. T32_za158]